MRLFEINEDRQIKLDKPWILLIPEFAEVMKQDKGSKGDTEARKKLKAVSHFTFVYFYTDFSSPIKDWEDADREKEAKYYAKLSNDEKIPPYVWKACEKYDELQLKASRPLRTLKALYKGLGAMNEFFESIDFTTKDKHGRLVNDPSDFVTNAGKLSKMYDEIRNFEKRVEDDLRQAASGIRGPNSTLGDNEGKSGKGWSERDIMMKSRQVAEGSTGTKGSFAAIAEMTQKMAQQELEDERKEREALTVPTNAIEPIKEEE